ncbi:MAG TPA: hypothetical protein VN688_10115 [Gemmataceae bacterium]|nr:hypothetical protein [Gemmataceae bacterium]
MSKPDRPILVTLLAISQLVVGGLLLVCGVFGLVATVAGSSSTTVTISDRGQSITRVYDTEEEMEKEAPGYKLFLLGGGGVSILLHVTMIAGAIGLLKLSAWGWWVSLTWALLRLLYQIITLGYLWFVAMPAANRMAHAVVRDRNGVLNSLVNGNTFYHIFWAIFF